MDPSACGVPCTSKDAKIGENDSNHENDSEDNHRSIVGSVAGLFSVEESCVNQSSESPSCASSTSLVMTGKVDALETMIKRFFVDVSNQMSEIEGIDLTIWGYQILGQGLQAFALEEDVDDEGKKTTMPLDGAGDACNGGSANEDGLEMEDTCDDVSSSGSSKSISSSSSVTDSEDSDEEYTDVKRSGGSSSSSTSSSSSNSSSSSSLSSSSSSASSSSSSPLSAKGTSSRSSSAISLVPANSKKRKASGPSNNPSSDVNKGVKAMAIPKKILQQVGHPTHKSPTEKKASTGPHLGAKRQKKGIPVQPSLNSATQPRTKTAPSVKGCLSKRDSVSLPPSSRSSGGSRSSSCNSSSCNSSSSSSSSSSCSDSE